MRFGVVLVPFPFDDPTGRKVRPAVILTDPVGTHRHVVLALITSAVPLALENRMCCSTRVAQTLRARDCAFAPRCASIAW